MSLISQTETKTDQIRKTKIYEYMYYSLPDETAERAENVRRAESPTTGFGFASD